MIETIHNYQASTNQLIVCLGTGLMTLAGSYFLAWAIRTRKRGAILVMTLWISIVGIVFVGALINRQRAAFVVTEQGVTIYNSLGRCAFVPNADMESLTLSRNGEFVNLKCRDGRSFRFTRDISRSEELVNELRAKIRR